MFSSGQEFSMVAMWPLSWMVMKSPLEKETMTIIFDDLVLGTWNFWERGFYKYILIYFNAENALPPCTRQDQHLNDVFLKVFWYLCMSVNLVFKIPIIDYSLLQ